MRNAVNRRFSDRANRYPWKTDSPESVEGDPKESESTRMANPIPHLPYIDPNVDHVDSKKFRHMPPHKLKALDRTTVLRDDDVPLAVLVPYSTFLEIQDELSRLKETVDEYEFPDLDSLWDDSLDSVSLDEFDDLDEDDEFDDLDEDDEEDDQSKDDEDRSKLVDFKDTAVDKGNSKDGE